MSATAIAHANEDELIGLIGSDDASTVADAATVLGLRGGERVLDALVELLHHPVAAARASAANALGLLGIDRAIPDLRRAITDPDPSVAAHASLALKRLGDDESESAVVRSLVEEMHAADDDRRALAARALGGLSRSLAVGPLLVALADTSAQVRADAACSLGWIGDERATEPLTRLAFTDPDPFVREVAMHAIARLVVPGTPV